MKSDLYWLFHAFDVPEKRPVIHETTNQTEDELENKTGIIVEYKFF